MSEVRPIWIAVALFGIVAAIILLTRATEKIAPVPQVLRVAIQPEGEAVARVGPVETSAGAAFRLHAVLEAETFRGSRVYYTEAKQLELRGETIPAERLRPWSGRLEPRLLWFAVEASRPYREADPSEELAAPRFREIFRPDWGSAWSVAGDVRPAVENFLPDDERVGRPKRFGTQRFQVRMEFFGSGSELVPELRLASPGAADLPAKAEEFATVTAALGSALRVPSRVFGLPQIESASGRMSPAMAKQMLTWTDSLVAFSRVSVLGRWLAAENATWEDLTWQAVELGVADTPAQPGDLLRVGARLVWLLEDRGEPGLDGEDLCLDFERGARVGKLRQVFVGEGLVEWAPFPSAAGDRRTVVQ